MTQTCAAYTVATDSAAAGRDLAEQIRAGLEGGKPDAVIVFASARFDHEQLLRALTEICDPGVLVGSSSAGEFTGGHRGEGSACALAIRSPIMRFAAGVGTGISRDRAAAARQVAASFQGLQRHDYPSRTALVLTDALAGHADDLIEQLTEATLGSYEFAGGGAGDDARFARTHVFCGTRVINDAVVALEIISQKPLGIGAQHGWTPASEPYRVTSTDGTRILTLDGYPAIEIFEQHAAATGQTIVRDAPLPFFLHNILGIETGSEHRLRVPLSVAAGGAVVCAAEVPEGATVRIMKTSSASASDAAASAARSAVRALGGATPAAALFFDCVATRLRLGDVFGFELEAVQGVMRGADLVGCNTYGQIARAPGQFGGFHNCTAVVLALPR